jgi:hypothetical protein
VQKTRALDLKGSDYTQASIKNNRRVPAESTQAIGLNQLQSKSSRRKLLLYIEGLLKSGQTAHRPQASINQNLKKLKKSCRKLLLYI